MIRIIYEFDTILIQIVYTNRLHDFDTNCVYELLRIAYESHTNCTVQAIRNLTSFSHRRSRAMSHDVVRFRAKPYHFVRKNRTTFFRTKSWSESATVKRKWNVSFVRNRRLKQDVFFVRNHKAKAVRTKFRNIYFK